MRRTLLYTDSIYFSAALSFGSVTFKKTATRVAITTGDLPKMVVTQSGKEAKEAEACETPIPRAAAKTYDGGIAVVHIFRHNKLHAGHGDGCEHRYGSAA